MHPWLLLGRPASVIAACLFAAMVASCTKTNKNRGPVPVITNDAQRVQAPSLAVGSTTKDTVGACRKPAEGSEPEEADEESSEDDTEDDEEEGSSLRLASDDDVGGSSRTSVSAGGFSTRAAEDAEAIVDQTCRQCHGGGVSAANSGPQGGSARRRSGRRRDDNRVSRSSIQFGGRDDLEIRANDIIQEFENPGPQHSSITDPDVVVQAFKDLKKAKQKRLEKDSKKCS